MVKERGTTEEREGKIKWVREDKLEGKKAKRARRMGKEEMHGGKKEMGKAERQGKREKWGRERGRKSEENGEGKEGMRSR